MDVRLDRVGKRFNRQWVIRSMDYFFRSGLNYGIRGPNGSGKSTLVRLISGFLTPSRGSISYQLDEVQIPRDEVYRHINIAAPYIELIEEFSLRELIEFQERFKPFSKQSSTGEIMNTLGLIQFADEPIKDFSSGMKQRLRLLLALTTQAQIVLLDEPSTNLDREGIRWLSGLIDDYGRDKTIILASNEPDDFQQCEEMIDVRNYK